MKAKKKSKGAKRVMHKATDQHDITELMLRDHKPLKRLIKVLKEPSSERANLKAAFEEFASLLEAHAKPEEESLYRHMESETAEEVRMQGFEGQTEHAIADWLAKQVPSLGNEDEWKAQLKVLAELVEHHVEEEESEMIPTLRKELSLDERVEIGRNYLRRRSEFGFETEAA